MLHPVGCYPNKTSVCLHCAEYDFKQGCSAAVLSSATNACPLSRFASKKDLIYFIACDAFLFESCLIFSNIPYTCSNNIS